MRLLPQDWPGVGQLVSSLDVQGGLGFWKGTLGHAGLHLLPFLQVPLWVPACPLEPLLDGSAPCGDMSLTHLAYLPTSASYK